MASSPTAGEEGNLNLFYDHHLNRGGTRNGSNTSTGNSSSNSNVVNNADLPYMRLVQAQQNLAYRPYEDVSRLLLVVLLLVFLLLSYAYCYYYC